LVYEAKLQGEKGGYQMVAA